MIQVTMTEKGKEKKVVTNVFCDECDKGLSWTSKRFSHFIGISLAKSILRKEGRRHRCSDCLLKKKEQ